MLCKYNCGRKNAVLTENMFWKRISFEKNSCVLSVIQTSGTVSQITFPIVMSRHEDVCFQHVRHNWTMSEEKTNSKTFTKTYIYNTIFRVRIISNFSLFCNDLQTSMDPLYFIELFGFGRENTKKEFDLE